ncbi:hypothetical protein ABZ622_38695 [Streptomyces sp. NPDC007164]|uniref:hypothetical protein n=1 Tax=Streptomyces sp. NPDC007164 TaxID=3156918 RepID=UPI0033E22359
MTDDICNALKKTLDGIGKPGGPGSSDGGKAMAYIAAYAAAVARGCAFIHESSDNPYHVYDFEPEEKGIGKPFALQTQPFDNQTHGVILEVRDDGTLKGAANPSNESRIPRSVFQYVATGQQAQGRWAYKLLVKEGPQAGMCVERSTDLESGRNKAHVADFDRVKTIFTTEYIKPSFPRSTPNGYYLYAYNADTLEYKGALLIEYNRRDGSATFDKTKYGDEKPEQLFSYRPAGQWT